MYIEALQCAFTKHHLNYIRSFKHRRLEPARLTRTTLFIPNNMCNVPCPPVSQYSHPSEEEVRRKPWRYRGYPAFAEWMASADDFMVLRRFSKLNARVLLMMQDEIVQKEEELDQLDAETRKRCGMEGNSSTLRFEPCPRRRELVEEAKTLLKEYSESTKFLITLFA